MIGTVLDAVAGFGVCGGMLASSYGLHYRLKKGEHEFERERRTLQAQRLDAEARAWIASIPSQAVSEALGDAQGARRADTAWMDIVGIPLELWVKAGQPGEIGLDVLIARREAGGFKPKLTAPEQDAQARLEADAALVAPKPVVSPPRGLISRPEPPTPHGADDRDRFVTGVNAKGEGWAVRRQPVIRTLHCPFCGAGGNAVRVDDTGGEWACTFCGDHWITGQRIREPSVIFVGETEVKTQRHVQSDQVSVRALRCRQDKAIQVELMKQAWKRRYEDDLYEDEDED